MLRFSVSSLSFLQVSLVDFLLTTVLSRAHSGLLTNISTRASRHEKRHRGFNVQQRPPDKLEAHLQSFSSNLRSKNGFVVSVPRASCIPSSEDPWEVWNFHFTAPCWEYHLSLSVITQCVKAGTSFCVCESVNMQLFDAKWMKDSNVALKHPRLLSFATVPSCFFIFGTFIVVTCCKTVVADAFMPCWPAVFSVPQDRQGFVSYVFNNQRFLRSSLFCTYGFNLWTLFCSRWEQPSVTADRSDLVSSPAGLLGVYYHASQSISAGHKPRTVSAVVQTGIQSKLWKSGLHTSV